MRGTLSFVAACIGILLSRTFLSGAGLTAELLLYALALFLLFRTRTSGTSFLAGLAVSTELLGSARFGQALLYACIILILSIVAGHQLRFTSQLVRYIVALLIAVLVYPLLLLSPHSYTLYLPAMALGFILSVMAAYLLLSSDSGEQEYEFI